MHELEELQLQEAMRLSALLIEPPTPEVPATPPTASAIELPRQSRSKPAGPRETVQLPPMSGTDAVDISTGDTPRDFNESLTVSRPRVDNPARRARRLRQQSKPSAAPSAQSTSTAIEYQPPPPTRSISAVRPPTASAATHADHSSWHMPELPPVSKVPPPAAGSGRGTGHHGRSGRGGKGGKGGKGGGAAVIAWLRQEMRLEDNAALTAAAASGHPVIPVYILPHDDEEGGWPLLGAARYWQHHAINQLQHSLAAIGSGLVLRDANGGSGGGSLLQLMMLCEETGAHDVYMCASCEPWRRARDAEIVRALAEGGVRVHEQEGSTLYVPFGCHPHPTSLNPVRAFWMPSPPYLP